MQYRQYTFQDHDGIENYVHEWLPEQNGSIVGLVQIVHGMGEHALRYESFAQALTDNGYAVRAMDHRGHGLTGKAMNTVGYLGNDGFQSLVENVDRVFTQLSRDFPNQPLYLFGHSMGSFVSKRYIEVYGGRLKGVILSGSSGLLNPMTNIGIFLASRIARKRGEDFDSHVLRQLSFGSFNKRFTPNRTECDWLSRDTVEVDKYVNDPLCGSVLTAGSFRDFLRGLKAIQKPSSLQGIPKHLPIFIVSGDQDPVGEYGKGVVALFRTYRKLAIADVEYKLYEGARHEILNETVRDEVVADILAWLKRH